MGQTVDQILAERQNTHGEYAEHARSTQNLMRMMQAERNWPTLSDMQKETLHMIAHKIGRVLTGNPNVADHWDDIAGYSRLISQRIETPVVPFNSDGVYETLARGSDCSIEEAKRRFPQKAQPPTTVSRLPETVARHMEDDATTAEKPVGRFSPEGRAAAAAKQD